MNNMNINNIYNILAFFTASTALFFIFGLICIKSCDSYALTLIFIGFFLLLVTVWIFSIILKKRNATIVGPSSENKFLMPINYGPSV